MRKTIKDFFIYNGLGQTLLVLFLLFIAITIGMAVSVFFVYVLTNVTFFEAFMSIDTQGGGVVVVTFLVIGLATYIHHLKNK